MLNIPRMDDPKIKKMLEQRKVEMIRLRSTGMTLDEIGKKYGISRQRVHQIIYRKK